MTRSDATTPTGHDVLVVDDEPQVLAVVAEYLEREGYRVRTAADGDAALAELAAKRPDLVLLDLMLPGTDGWTILDRLRSAGDEVPVIVLSARGAESERVAGLELGADDYLPKPIDKAKLLGMVVRYTRELTPDEIHLPGVYVDRVVQTVSEKRIEQRTVSS